MRISTLISALIPLGFAYGAGKQVAVYWGQDLGGGEKPLSEYCNNESVNIVIISYLSEFDGLNTPKINLKSACSSQWCTGVGQDIRDCQSKGKKVLLSLGGPTGKYNIGSNEAADTLAGQLWSMFFDKSSQTQPLGDVSLDGIDLSVENLQGRFYSDLVNNLRKLSQSSKKKLIISASPGCKYPDPNLDDAINNAQFDYLFVKFYNNPTCETDANINIQQWDQWAQGVPSVKLFMGVPGQRQVVESGYLPLDNVKRRVDAVGKNIKSYGGVAIYDASSAFNDDSFGNDLAKYVHSSAVALSNVSFQILFSVMLGTISVLV